MSHSEYHLSIRGEGVLVDLDITQDIAEHILSLMKQSGVPIVFTPAPGVDQGSEAAGEEAI